MIKEVRLNHEIVKRNTVNFITQLPVDKKYPIRILIEEENEEKKRYELMLQLFTDIANQTLWDRESLSPQNWQQLITVHLYGQANLRGIDGDPIFLTMNNPHKSKKTFSNVIVCAERMGIKKGVKFGKEAKEAIRLARQYKFDNL